MNPLRRVRFVAALLALSVSLAAQLTPTPPVPLIVTPIGYARKITTSITLGQTPFVESILPFPYPPVPPVNVAVGSDLILSTPFADADIASIAWFRGSTNFPYEGHTLKISAAIPSDSGSYGASVRLTDGTYWSSDPVVVRVVTPVWQQFLNLSSRATIDAANPTLISGFVIAASPGSLRETKTLLLRAVGPSLAKFAVAHPLAAPQLRLFRQDGSEVPLPGARIPESPSPAQIGARIGAFPLLAGAADVVAVMSLPAGVYTAHVTGAGGSTGDVLLEIYEVSDDALWWGSYMAPLLPVTPSGLPPGSTPATPAAR